MQDTPLLEMRNISKVFPGVRALNQVSIALQAGEVRALVGENGAGKSTLIKILSGVYQPTEGEIFLDGRQELIQDPAHALKLGIIPVHQEVNLEPYLSIAENIFIGRQPRNRFGLIDFGQMNKDAARWLSELGVATDPSLPLGMISIAERQMVAIARAVSLDARVVIFDEPTSSLTLRETERLFTVIRRLKDKEHRGHLYFAPAGRNLPHLRHVDGHARRRPGGHQGHCRREHRQRDPHDDWP